MEFKVNATMDDKKFMKAALEEAKKGYASGGVPVGAILVEDGKIIGRGYNQRVQKMDPIAHGEMDCIRNAGRRARYGEATIYTTLAPCMMCTGAIIQFGIRRVVIGENVNFEGNADLLREYGVEVLNLHDKGCIALMSKFIAEKPELWDEDIAGRENV